MPISDSELDKLIEELKKTGQLDKILNQGGGGELPTQNNQMESAAPIAENNAGSAPFDWEKLGAGTQDVGKGLTNLSLALSDRPQDMPGEYSSSLDKLASKRSQSKKDALAQMYAQNREKRDVASADLEREKFEYSKESKPKPLTFQQQKELKGIKPGGTGDSEQKNVKDQVMKLMSIYKDDKDVVRKLSGVRTQQDLNKALEEDPGLLDSLTQGVGNLWDKITNFGSPSKEKEWGAESNSNIKNTSQSYPKQVKNSSTGKIATVSNADEEKAANQKGFY